MTEVRIPVEFSMACLGIVIAACFLGLVSRHYRDNWLQAAGLAGVIFWALGAGGLASLMASDDVGFFQFLAHASLASFAIGTGWKVWKHRHD